MSTHEPPTLEGRTMVDLGRQLAQVRRVSAETVARLEAENARLRVALESIVTNGRGGWREARRALEAEMMTKATTKRPQSCSVCRRDDGTTEHACE